MRIEAEKGGCSIVLLGGFNPSIFTPEWFARYEIATETEKNDSTVSIIHPEISNFKLGSKLIQVDLTRFSVESTEAPWVALMDFVTKTFGQFLIHTPINRIGIIDKFISGSEVKRTATASGDCLLPRPRGENGENESMMPLKIGVVGSPISRCRRRGKVVEVQFRPPSSRQC